MLGVNIRLVIGLLMAYYLLIINDSLLVGVVLTILPNTGHCVARGVEFDAVEVAVEGYPKASAVGAFACGQVANVILPSETFPLIRYRKAADFLVVNQPYVHYAVAVFGHSHAALYFLTPFARAYQVGFRFISDIEVAVLYRV